MQQQISAPFDQYYFEKPEAAAEAARTLFLGDLSYFCTEDDLCNVFAPYGRILTVRVRRGVTGESLMHGFIALETAEAAQRAIIDLDRYEIMGRNMRVQLSSDGQRPSAQLKDSYVQVHVSFITKQLTTTITEKVLREIFSPFGTIADVAIKKHSTIQKQHRQSGYGFVYFFEADAAYRAMNTLKQNTVREITFDCSISHKSENLIRQQSRNNMGNWEQDFTAASGGNNMSPSNLNSSLHGMPVGNSNSSTPVNALSRKTSAENMQTTTSPPLSRPASMTSINQFVRHGSQDSMREGHSLSRGNSMVMNNSGYSVPVSSANNSNRMIGSIPAPTTTPHNGSLMRTYSGNSSTSFNSSRDYFPNISEGDSDIGRLTMQHSNRSTDSVSTMSSLLNMPPSSSPLTTAQRGNRSFLRENNNNNSNNSSSNSIVMVDSRGLGFGEIIDENEFRPNNNSSFSRLPIPPAYNNNTSNNNIMRTLHRPDSDLSINSNGGGHGGGGGRYSRNSSLNTMGSFHGNNVNPTLSLSSHNSNNNMSQHSLSHSSPAQSLPQRSIYSQNQYESFYGEPIAQVSLSASQSFYMKDLDSILSFSSTPTTSTAPSMSQNNHSHNSSLHSSIPQQDQMSVHVRSNRHSSSSSHPMPPMSIDQQSSNHTMLSNSLNMQYGGNSASSMMDHLHGISPTPHVVNNQGGFRNHNSSNNSSARNLHQLMTTIHDPELDLIGPNEPLTVDLAGILNSL